MSRRRIVSLMTLLCLLVSLATTTAAPAPKRYLVIERFRGTISLAAAQVRSLGAQVEGIYTGFGILKALSSDEQFARRMTALGYVAVLDSTLNVKIPAAVALPPKGANQANTASIQAAGMANDPLRPLQWGMTTVNAEKAWAAGRTGQGVVVAVLDTGFWLQHPDLAPNLLVSKGKSFIDGEGLQFNPAVANGHESHGTHVSGIIAAVANNLTGVVGVAPKAKILPIKILSDAGSGSYSGVVDGMAYALSQRVNIVNMSLGSYCLLANPTCQATRTLLQQAVDGLYNAGILVVVAMGNDFVNQNDYPGYLFMMAQLNHVLAISATGPSMWLIDRSAANFRTMADFSNTGSAVGFAAPGGSIYQTPQYRCTALGYNMTCGDFDSILSVGSYQNGVAKYVFMSGTSMATPLAAGIAAGILSQHPTYKPLQLIAAMDAQAENLSPTTSYGMGFLKAAK